MPKPQRSLMRAGLVYACVLSLFAILLVGAPRYGFEGAAVPDAYAQSPGTVGVNGAASQPYGVRLIGSDNTTDHWVGVDASGNLYTWDKSNNTPHLEVNIRANNGLKTKFVSAPIDMSLFGVWKNIAIRAIGPTTASTASIYVGIEGAATSVFDSTTAFPFPLGGCNPAGTGTGMRLVPSSATILTDSTIVARPAALLGLVDSSNGAPFTAPYARLIVQTTSTQANNVYLHIFGGLR